METLEYKEEYVDPIVTRHKNCTIRREDGDCLSEGDKFSAKTNDGVLFAVLRVTRKVKRSAEWIVNSNIEGHRNYDSIDEFFDQMSRFYSVERDADADFYVIWHEVVNLVSTYGR